MCLECEMSPQRLGLQLVALLWNLVEFFGGKARGMGHWSGGLVCFSLVPDLGLVSLFLGPLGCKKVAISFLIGCTVSLPQ